MRLRWRAQHSDEQKVVRYIYIYNIYIYIWVVRCAGFASLQPSVVSLLFPPNISPPNLHSWEAVQVEDYIHLGEPPYPSPRIYFVFGCQRKETGLFLQQTTDGIMGLAMSPSGVMTHMLEMSNIQVRRRA